MGRMNLTIDADLMDRIHALREACRPVSLNVSAVCAKAIARALDALPDVPVRQRVPSRLSVSLDDELVSGVEAARAAGHDLNVSKACAEAIRDALDSLERSLLPS